MRVFIKGEATIVTINGFWAPLSAPGSHCNTAASRFLSLVTPVQILPWQVKLSHPEFTPWLKKTAMCVLACGCTRYGGCTLQVVCAAECEWRYHKDNLTMSQIFIGTVPLMGAANEILRAAPATFEAGVRHRGRCWRSYAAGWPTCTQNSTQTPWYGTTSLQHRHHRCLKFCHLLHWSNQI